MAETEQSPPQSVTSAAENLPKFSFSIWPPTERTREAVRNRLIENLSAPSVVSNKYGTVPREEAVDTAARIEEESFGEAGKSSVTDDDGIEILQVYSKEISKRMLDTMKARSGEPVLSALIKEVFKVDEDDATPPQSEKVESVPDDE